MADWADEKVREMAETTQKNSSGDYYSEWTFCNKCQDLTQFDGDKCMKCGTVKK